MKSFRGFFIGVMTVISVVVFCSVSHGSIAREFTYGESTVWRCAVRFLRVDKGYKIIEKDKDTGYLMFEYTENDRTYNGSLEVLKLVKNDREYVRVQMNLHGQPKYMESLLFKKLERKLKNEYGRAPSPKYVGPPSVEPTKDEATAQGAASVDEDANEKDLEITEDDLNDALED